MAKMLLGDGIKARTYITLSSGETIFLKETVKSLKCKLRDYNDDNVELIPSQGIIGWIFAGNVVVRKERIIHYGCVNLKMKFQFILAELKGRNN